MCAMGRDVEERERGGGLKRSVSVSISLINAVNTSAFPEFFVDFTF